VLGDVAGGRLAGDVVDGDVGALLGERDGDGPSDSREPPVTRAVRPFNFIGNILLRALENASLARPVLVSVDARC
jgi:hypothetical protein